MPESTRFTRADWDGGIFLGERLLVVTIIVEDLEISSAVNQLLHEFAPYIVGRMGIPYREHGVSIICVVMHAPGDIASALSGKLGMLKGVSSRTTVAKHQTKKEG